MKKFNTAGMLAVLMLCLTACGSGTDAGETDMNSLTLVKNGSVENTIVESFDKEYYDLEGLNTMIGDSIEQYCAQNPTAEITLTRSEVTDDKVKVNMKYDSAATYMGYNPTLINNNVKTLVRTPNQGRRAFITLPVIIFIISALLLVASIVILFVLD